MTEIPPPEPAALPAALAVLLAGQPAPGATEQAFPFLTVDPEGYPHVALLSRAEVETGPAGDAVLVAVASRQTRANLARDGRCTLIAVAGDTAHYAKFRVSASIPTPELLGCELRLTAYKADSLGIPLSPIAFTTTGELAELEHWDRSAALLEQLAAGGASG